MPESIQLGGIYRHFKGNFYKVLHLAKHSETEETMVVYQKLYGEHDIWVRPLDMFLDYKEVDGKLVKRFEVVEKIEMVEQIETVEQTQDFEYVSDKI